MKKSLLPTFLALAFLISGCSNYNNTYPDDAIVKTYYWEGLTDEDIEFMKSEEGVYDVTINEDGSINYVVSREYLEEGKLIYYNEIQSYLEEYSTEGIIPSLSYINMNEDMTFFEIYLNSDEITIYEIFLTEELILYGTTYHQYFSEDSEIPEIYVKIFNSENELINEYSSSSFYENIESILDEEYLEKLYEEANSDHEH